MKPLPLFYFSFPLLWVLNLWISLNLSSLKLTYTYFSQFRNGRIFIGAAVCCLVEIGRWGGLSFLCLSEVLFLYQCLPCSLIFFARRNKKTMCLGSVASRYSVSNSGTSIQARTKPKVTANITKQLIGPLAVIFDIISPQAEVLIELASCQWKWKLKAIWQLSGWSCSGCSWAIGEQKTDWSSRCMFVKSRMWLVACRVGWSNFPHYIVTPEFVICFQTMFTANNWRKTGIFDLTGNSRIF